MTPEKKKKIMENWKAIQNLPIGGEKAAEKSGEKEVSNMDIEDFMEIFIPFEELGKDEKD